ncbi:putative phosphotransferase enzyme family protein [Aspergillus niger]|nr:putative phosphotransferase enzyme family protein [Aspergillus niger]
MFEYGEAHFQSLLVDLKDHWEDLPGVSGDFPFPFSFSDAEIERNKLVSDGAVAGTELVAGVKEQLGDLWPDKGLIEHERYEECRAALEEVRDRIVEELGESEEEREEYRRLWPFD